MPRGDKSSYTGKQKRKARNIEEGYEKRGVGGREAERRAWATVNRETGGGKKSGSGRGKTETRVSSRKAGGSAARRRLRGRQQRGSSRPRRLPPPASGGHRRRAPARRRLQRLERRESAQLSGGARNS